MKYKANKKIMLYGFFAEVGLFFSAGFLLSKGNPIGILLLLIGVGLAIKVGDEIQILGIERHKRGDL